MMSRREGDDAEKVRLGPPPDALLRALDARGPWERLYDFADERLDLGSLVVD